MRLIPTLALLFALPASLAASSDPQPQSRELNPLETFQRSEDRLFRVGYRLTTANAQFCEHTTQTSGMLLHDAQSYARPAEVREFFRLSGDIGVQSVAQGSPAQQAGIVRNDTLLSIGGSAIDQTWKPTDPAWKRTASIREDLDEALARGSVEIEWAHPGAGPRHAAIGGVAACSTRFELIDSSSSAKADGNRVLIGEDFPGLAYDEDAFAAAIAHEMAHNILGHPQTFEKIGWKRRLVRISERDADRLMPWLLQNAGYDPAAAVRFMAKWGPKHDGGLFRKRNHDGWDERVEFIEAELPKVAASKNANGKVDWKANFKPMFDREAGD